MGELKLPDDYYDEDGSPYNAKRLTARERAQAMGWPVDVGDQKDSEPPTDDPEEAEEEFGQNDQPETATGPAVSVGRETGVESDPDDRPTSAPEETSLFNNGKTSKITGEIKGVGKKKRFGSLRKRLLLGALMGMAGLVIFIIFLVSYFGSFKVIQLAENITAWNMARSARDFRIGSSQAIEESIAGETADATFLQTLKDSFGESKVGKMLDTYTKKFRPNKMFKVLGKNMENIYAADGTYTGIRIGDVFIEKANKSFFHPIKSYRDRIRFSAEADFAIERELQGTSGFVRNGVLKRVLKENGIKLRFWEKNGEKYKGLKQNMAELQQQYDIEESRNNPESSCRIVKQVCETQKEVDATIKKTVKDELDAGTGNGATVDEKVAKNSTKAAVDGLEKSGLEKALGATGLLYAVAVPLCLIYEGSIVNAQQSIDNSEKALLQTGFDIRTAADQQKAGASTAAAIAAYSGKIGSTSNSIPERRASGKAVDSTAETTFISQPQSSSSGAYSIVDVLFGPGGVSGTLNTLASKGCPQITNLKTAAAITAAEYALSALVGGPQNEEAAIQATKPLITRVLEKIAANITFSGTRAAINKTGVVNGFIAPISKFAIKTGVLVGATLGATELAKMAVVKYSATQNRGLAVNEEYANQADMGIVIYNNQVEKEMLRGRPLTAAEVTESKLADLEDIRNINSHKSFTERYFALTNPSSLASRMGSNMSSIFENPGGMSSNILNTIGNIFSSLPHSLFGIIAPRRAQALTTVSGAGDYNIVQWGWSNKELALSTNNPDYFPMMNQLILDKSGQADEIEKEYGKCFTSSNGTLLSGSDNDNKPEIVRDTNGSLVEDQGDCSPKNLGIGNNKFGENMVFRWRLANRNKNILDHMLEIQNPTEGASSTPIISNPSSPITGTNGYTIPCKGQPAAVKKLAGPRADWTGVPDSGTFGTNSAGEPMKVYIRAACNPTNQRTVLVGGGIHGTENAGGLVAWELLFNATLPDDVRIIAIPEVNGFGINNYTRKNKNGVDLNRNQDFNWTYAGDPEKCSEINPSCKYYKGSSAGSEPETKALDTLLLSIGKTNLFVMYHDNIHYVAPVGSTSKTIGDSYATSVGMTGKDTGKVGSTVTVSQHGSLDGWYNAKTTSPTLLIEMDTDQSAAVIQKHVDAIKKLLSDEAI